MTKRRHASAAACAGSSRSAASASLKSAAGACGAPRLKRRAARRERRLGVGDFRKMAQAEALQLREHRPDEARAELQKVLDAPLDPDWAPEDREFKQKAEKRIKGS